MSGDASNLCRSRFAALLRRSGHACLFVEPTLVTLLRERGGTDGD